MTATTKHVLIGLTFAAALVIGGAAQAQPRAAFVDVSPVVQQEIAAGQTFVGSVMPSRTAIVGSAVDGRVIEFPREEGDRVEQGQPLAQLLTDTIELEVEAAQAELELRQQELAELENGLRPEEVEQARVRMIGAEARMKYMNARRARVENLYNKDRAISQEERDEAVSTAIEAMQAFLDARESYQLAVQGHRKERIAQARAQVAMQQATVDRLKDMLTKHTIVSRFDGYVTAEHTEVGQWVKQGDPVAEVAALDEVDVIAQVVEQYVPFIRIGTMVRVEIPAIPNRLFEGEVTAIVPQADVQARTFPVKVRVKNEAPDNVPLIKAGMYARVELATGSKQQALLVSKDALVLGGRQPIVYVVDLASADAKQGKVRPVPVQMGVASGRLMQVFGPLEPGQLVVVHGNERLFPGQDVQIQRVLQAPEASAAESLSQNANP
jgi:RND family efflux transporter MFP subunit